MSEFKLSPETALSEAQADGQECVRCGGEAGPMVPVGHANGVQVFAHEEGSCR